MKNNSSSRIVWIVVIAAMSLFLIGLLRDFIFTNLNKELPSDVRKALGGNPFSGSGMILWKWILTLVFSVAYAFISGLIVHFLYHRQNLMRLSWIVFACTFTMSLAMVGIGKISGRHEPFYTLSRDLAGLVQSPFLLMLMIPAFYLYSRQHAEQK